MNNPNPCNECPFRRKSWRGWIGGHEHVSEIIDLVEHDLKFPCHIKVNEIQIHLLESVNAYLEPDCSLHMSKDQAFHTATEMAPHCVGALAYMNNTCKRSRDRQIATAQDAVGTRRDVFDDRHEMIAHHHPEENHEDGDSRQPGGDQKEPENGRTKAAHHRKDVQGQPVRSQRRPARPRRKSGRPRTL